MSDDPLTDRTQSVPPEHDAARYLSPKWKRKEAELARVVKRQRKLRMERMHSKVKAGGMAGGAVAVLTGALEIIKPGLLAALGVSSPIATAIAAIASLGAAYMKSSTPDDLPTDVQNLLTTMENADINWDDVAAYFEPQLRAIGKEGLQSLAEMVQDENGQKLIVAAANNDIDVEWIPENIEGVAMDQVYNAMQFGVGRLAEKGLELLDFDEDTGGKGA